MIKNGNNIKLITVINYNNEFEKHRQHLITIIPAIKRQQRNRTASGETDNIDEASVTSKIVAKQCPGRNR